MTPIETVVARLGDSVRRSGAGWIGRCPAHDDRAPSLSATEGDDGRVLLHCHAGCSPEDVVAALGLTMADLFPGESRQVRRARARTTTKLPAQSGAAPAGYTVEAYARDKKLPSTFLESEFGLSNVKKNGAYVIRMPYQDELARGTSDRYRHSLDGEKRFSWEEGATPGLYGLHRLPLIRAQGHVVLVEGESDVHTGWFHGFPVVGIPGATTWQDDWGSLLEQLDPIYFVQEPDKGGQVLRDRLAQSPIADRLRVVQLDGAKDLSDLHCQEA